MRLGTAFAALAALFVNAIPASADAGILAAQAKVHSYQCSRPSRSRMGSGTVFRLSGRTYVLTSDHVLFHGNSPEGICHQIVGGTENSSPANATLRAVHVFHGLALLEVISRSSLRGIEPIDGNILLKPQKPSDAGFSQLTGFPIHSSTVLIDQASRVLNVAGSRPVLPFQNRMIEVWGHSEYGMSGGAWIDSAGAFGGVLSHQYLSVPEAGKPAQIRDYESGNSPQELIALIIPRDSVATWLSGVFENRAGTDLRWDVQAQLSNKAVLSAEGIQWTAIDCLRPQGLVGGSSSGDGAGIGGSSSGDGAGIGGKNFPASAGDSAQANCRILLEWNGNQAKSQAFGLSAPAWLKDVQNRLLAGDRVEIVGVLQNDSQVPLSSLLDFFNRTFRGAQPLVRIFSSNPQSETDRAILPLVDEANRLLSALPDALFKTDITASDLYMDSHELLATLGNRQYEWIQRPDLQRLIDSPGWSVLMVESATKLELFNQVVRLKTIFLSLKERLARVRI